MLLSDTSPAVSLIIPCRNETAYIETCLQSVLAFEEPPGGFEVVIADGMSDDDTRAIIERIAAADPRVRMVDNPDRTTPFALNAAIREARGSIIIRIDAHTEYAPDYAVRCVEVLRETGADNVGGPWVARGKTYLQRAIAAAFGSAFAIGGARGHRPDYDGPVDTVYLGCWPRAVFDRIGLFDEELVRNQDDEFNFRLLRAGGRVWQSPRIRSWYTPRGSLSALFRQYFQWGYWKIYVMRKHGRPAALRHVVPGLFVTSLVVLAAAAPFLHLASVALTVLMGTYVAACLVATMPTASRAGWSLLPVLPPVFATYHFGYGLGCLFGVWDFLIRCQPSGRFVALTRS